MDKEINNNDYEYVDFELPSGTLWATCNVGATKPSDAGLYFQWGDTKGYTKEQLGIGEGRKAFRWSNYKFSYQESYISFTKYTTPGAALDLEDDAAHVHMEGDWHMPSPTQAQELLDYTKSVWTTQDGINGRLFTSKKDASKSIFIPAAGSFGYGLVLNDDVECPLWLSNLDSDYFMDSQDLYISSTKAQLSYDYRFYGFPIRGVIG